MAYGTIGTGIQQPSAQLVATLNAISQKYVYPTIGDVTFVPSPLFWGLTKRGKDIREGAEIVYPLATTEEMTGGSYYGDQLLNTTVIDSIQPANQVWRPYYQSVSIPVTDIILGRGGPMGLDLVKSKMQIGSASFLQKLCRAVWHTSPQNTSTDVDDIPDWVYQTTNTIAGINRSSNAFWKPATPVAGGGTLTPTVFEQGYQSVTYGYDEPDLFVTDNGNFANFKLNFTTLIRYMDLEQDETALQAGFRYHFVVNNALIMADRYVPATYAYLLNSKYIFPIFNANDYFKIDPWMQPSNQRVMVSKMYLTWQIACISPRMNVAFTGLTD